jgi:hypothetical protein
MTSRGLGSSVSTSSSGASSKVTAGWRSRHIKGRLHTILRAFDDDIRRLAQLDLADHGGLTRGTV